MNRFLHPLKRPIKKSLATAKLFFCPSDETCGLCPQICYANVRLCSPSAKEFKSLCTKQEKQKRYRQSNDYLYLLNYKAIFDTGCKSCILNFGLHLECNSYSSVTYFQWYPPQVVLFFIELVMLQDFLSINCAADFKDSNVLSNSTQYTLFVFWHLRQPCRLFPVREAITEA